MWHSSFCGCLILNLLLHNILGDGMTSATHIPQYRLIASGYEAFRHRYPGTVHYYHSHKGMWDGNKSWPQLILALALYIFNIYINLLFVCFKFSQSPILFFMDNDWKVSINFVHSSNEQLSLFLIDESSLQPDSCFLRWLKTNACWDIDSFLLCFISIILL